LSCGLCISAEVKLSQAEICLIALIYLVNLFLLSSDHDTPHLTGRFISILILGNNPPVDGLGIFEQLFDLLFLHFRVGAAQNPLLVLMRKNVKIMKEKYAERWSRCFVLSILFHPLSAG